jgi:hypothetical protein
MPEPFYELLTSFVIRATMRPQQQEMTCWEAGAPPEGSIARCPNVPSGQREPYLVGAYHVRQPDRRRSPEQGTPETQSSRVRDGSPAMALTMAPNEIRTATCYDPTVAT